MGTIITRKRKNGAASYMARVVIKENKKIIHREFKTFDRRAAATAWISRRETELRAPGGIKRAQAARVTLADAIDRLIAESRKAMGRTKTQVLKAIKEYPIAGKQCDKIDSGDIVGLAQALADGGRLPQTVENYLSHLSAVFAIARPAWGYALDQQAMADAFTVARRLGLTGKSRERDRRPTLDELNRVMRHFLDRSTRRPNSAPMHKIVPFAIFSTRRQEEISRIAWADFEPEHARVLVRDMKNPGDKIGNHVWCDLPEPAIRIINSMPRTDERIFPYSTDAIGAAFTRACATLGIDDLRFHDLRHDGVSRLFEIGLNIPKVASVSGHRSWQSLKRYTHLRQTGDKYAGWPWLEIVTAADVAGS